MNEINPPPDAYADPFDTQRALSDVTLYGILPLWMIPGFLDYLYHRKASIETTSGTHESMLHALQMTTAGIPVLMGLVLKINAPVIATMLAATVVHEALTLWDIAYAEPLRRPEPNEQHVHSFLEVVPIMALMSTCMLHPKATAAVFGRGDQRDDWRWQWKRPALNGRYIAGILGLVGAFLVVPYADELRRCYRIDGTFAPHRPPPQARS